ncbi:protein phosphatase 2C domain-containing protein [Slackia piriformis]|uniref:protein phosphatase 2C domain-containing protein n=1 Tax=Slackia piriformis TaxID=626934 RepID=UPI0026DCCB31|nr:protein phosphatase 2C domain-containing protein [Slackia piriformis]MDO5023936.1 protein phosphatase 2C domain-containing protein [Slackia piriformis]
MRCYRFTQTGTAHALRGGGNEDACLLAHRGDTVLAFMADGMGSAAFGGDAARLCVDVGSRVACAAFAPHELMSDESGAVAVKAAFLAAFNELQKDSVLANHPLAELQTTFMAVAFDARTGVLRFGYCGDGGLFVCLKDGSFAVAVQPQKGENVNLTNGVLDCDSWTFGRLENVAGFMMATDGLFDRMSKVDGSGRVIATLEALRAFAAAFSGAQSGAYCNADALFASLDAAESTPFSTVSDDRTVCVAASEDVRLSALRLASFRPDCERPFYKDDAAEPLCDESVAGGDAWSEYVPLPLCRASRGKRTVMRRAAKKGALPWS